MKNMEVSSNGQIIIPIPAATIMIGRETENGLELFMVVRHKKIDFASGALVFPGGKLTRDDMSDEWMSFLQDSPISDRLLPYALAAIRETFEESGILFAYDAATGKAVPENRLMELQEYRESLRCEKINLMSFFKAENLTPALDLLQPFAHWITPEIMPKRFDTIFFFAKAPSGQKGLHDGSESVDSLWITPEQVLSEYENNERTVLFPTRMNIMKLNRFGSLEEAFESIRKESVVTVLPWIEEREDGDFLCIQKDAGYQSTEESLKKILEMGG